MLARCTWQDAAERGGTPSPALPLSPAPVRPPRGACGLRRQDDTHGEGSGASPHSPLELQEAPAQGHQGENEEAETCPVPLCPAGDPPGAPLSRGSSPRLPFTCEEFPKTTPNASPAVSKGQDQGASAPRHQHCVRGPVSPGIVTRQLTVEGTGGKVVETRQLAANEEN